MENSDRVGVGRREIDAVRVRGGAAEFKSPADGTEIDAIDRSVGIVVSDGIKNANVLRV